MLREIRNTRQHPDEPFRRWFHSQEQDLYVWLDNDGEISAFQLCYNKPHNEHAIYWRQDRGFSHLRVDDGENSAPCSQTPILVADGIFEAEPLARHFSSLAKNLPEKIVSFVLEHLKNYSPSDQADL